MVTKRLSQLKRDLREAINSRELRLVEVQVDAKVNVELVAKLEKYWSSKP